MNFQSGCSAIPVEGEIEHYVIKRGCIAQPRLAVKGGSARVTIHRGSVEGVATAARAAVVTGKAHVVEQPLAQCNAFWIEGRLNGDRRDGFGGERRGYGL